MMRAYDKMIVNSWSKRRGTIYSARTGPPARLRSWEPRGSWPPTRRRCAPQGWIRWMRLDRRTLSAPRGRLPCRPVPCCGSRREPHWRTPGVAWSSTTSTTRRVASLPSTWPIAASSSPVTWSVEAGAPLPCPSMLGSDPSSASSAWTPGLSSPEGVGRRAPRCSRQLAPLWRAPRDAFRLPPPGCRPEAPVSRGRSRAPAPPERR